MTALASTIIWMIAAQAAVNFSGTWKLDSDASRITAPAGLAGLIRSGVPQTLHVTHSANGAVVIESQINESHARMYQPGGKTSTPVGPSGSITMTSKWDGRSLVSEGSQDASSGAALAVREVFALSEDGRTLTIHVTVAGAGVDASSNLVYRKTDAAEPCRNWPTPCKPR